MRLRAYPQYKGSGIEWLGNVPEQWDVLPLRRRLVDIKDGTHGSFERVSDGVPLLSAKNVIGGRVFTDENESLISAEDSTEITSNGFPRKGDVLLTIVGTVGRSAVFDFDEPMAFQRSVAFLRFQRDQNPNFVRFALESTVFQAHLQSFTNAAAQGGTYMGNVVGIPLAFPPVPEQYGIADFLDTETTKLDTLVAKKRELIEKLKEKRSALISRTVTRGLPPEAARAAGLNPNPKLKPSDIEWLGEIPEHWSFAQLRRYTSFITSGSRGWAEHYADAGSIFVRIGNLTRDSINVDLSDIQYVDPPPGAEGERTRICSGDLLFSITAYLGSVAVATDKVIGGYINQHIALVRLTGKVLTSRFVAYATLADLGQQQLNGQAYGGTKVQLALEDVKSLWLPIPPVSEQHAIADYLYRETSKIDRMVAKVEEAIERLQEYRTALITAAVTGKIDVRNVCHSGESLPRT